MKTLILLIAVVLTGTGCSTLSQKLQTSRFDTPESNGTTKRFKFDLEAAQANNYMAVPDTSARPPDLTHPSSDDVTQFGANFTGTLVDRLDLGLKLGEPGVFTVKFQLLGPTRAEAKAGDVSLAITGGIGTGADSNSSTTVTWGGQSYSWGGSLKTKTLDGAVIAGARLSDTLLLYGGVFYTDYKFDIRVDQGSDGVNPAASYSGQNGAYQRGANLGIEAMIGSTMYLMIEGVYSHLHSMSLDHDHYRVGYALGWAF